MKNVGKQFESAFKNSVPDYCDILRLNDAPQAFIQNRNTRFAPKNPCDFVMHDTERNIVYYIECKSTKYKSFSYEDIYSSEPQQKMIHKHQILGLEKHSNFKYQVAGFLFNFRDEEHDMERTYFQNIKDFMKMYSSLDKHSCNEMDLLLNGAIKVNGIKKRTVYNWNIDELLNTIGGSVI